MWAADSTGQRNTPLGPTLYGLVREGAQRTLCETLLTPTLNQLLRLCSLSEMLSLHSADRPAHSGFFNRLLAIRQVPQGVASTH